jgi:hypothetical protein
MKNFRGEADNDGAIRLRILVIKYSLRLKVSCRLITVMKQNYIRQSAWFEVLEIYLWIFKSDVLWRRLYW